MDLTQPLKDLVAKIPGAIGAILIDNEGEAVTYFARPEAAANTNERIRLIGAYHRIWLRDVLNLTQQFRLGTLDNLIHKYEDGTVLIKALKDNHALILVGSNELLVGQGKLYLNKIGKLLNEDL